MRAALAFLVAVGAVAPAPAAVFRDVVYVPGPADAPAQSLDVYTPATPGPHPVAIWLAGAGGKGATRGRHAAFNAHDMLFVSANVRTASAAVALDDTVALLAWAQRYASRYGGDPEHVHLLAAGASATLALAAVDDDARRADAGVATAMPASVVALAPSALPVPPRPAAPRASRVVVFDPADDAMHARVDAYVERARGAGIATLALPGAVRGADGIDRDFGTPTDPDAALVLAWIDSRTIARVPRFEQLVFARAEWPRGAASIAGLASAGDLSLVACTTEAGGARIDVADAPGARWRSEATWAGARVLALSALEGGVHALRVDASGPSWCERGTDGWRCMDVRGLSGEAPATLVAGGGERFATTSGADGGTFRVARDGDRYVARRDEPAAGLHARLVACGGALHAAAAGALWRREAASWRRVAQWLATSPEAGTARALACVPDPAGSGRDVVVAALADGRMLRIDATDASVVQELDAATAFRELWREPRLDASFGEAAAIALTQPDSGDVVHAFPLSFRFPAAPRAGAYWLLRALDGSYAYGVVRDFAEKDAAPAEVAFAAPPGGAVLVAARGASPALLRGELPPRGPRTGLWWDPARPGEAFELVRDGAEWNVFVHDHDRDGITRWTQHAGALRDGAFVEGGETAREGALRIEFAAAGDACPATRASATMARDGGVAHWCLEPFALPRAGRPTIDGSGTWRSVASNERWELATAAYGYDGGTSAWVMLRWVDERDRPRWAFGVAPQSRGALRADLDGGHCAGCRDEATAAVELHWQGACGEGGGVASLSLRDDGRVVLHRDAVAIAPVARQPCY